MWFLIPTDPLPRNAASSEPHCGKHPLSSVTRQLPALFILRPWGQRVCPTQSRPSCMDSEATAVP